jgi:bifunctional oligoribonuclease and PAP phosphatase NrnA
VILERTDLDAFCRAVSGADILVSAHVHPDPDAIGSALAMREMILQMGGHPHVVLEDEVPLRCRMLPGAEDAQVFAHLSERRKYDVAVVVDSGSLSRIGVVAELLGEKATVFNFDHHLSNDRFGTANFVDLACAATAELLFHVSRALNLRLTSSLATNLFAGLLTDTGRFRYSNTTSGSFRVAADLADAGAEISRVTNAMYYDVPPGNLFSMGNIFSTLELFADGRISTLFCRLDHVVEDPDYVVDMGLAVHAVEVAVLFSETREGKIRVSLRSKSSVNVSAIAERFGGGGHEKAAGFRMRGTLESVRERLLPALYHALNIPLHEATAQVF